MLALGKEKHCLIRDTDFIMVNVGRDKCTHFVTANLQRALELVLVPSATDNVIDMSFFLLGRLTIWHFSFGFFGLVWS